ncbi:MAG: metalloregulator ArsR/SmtB family transcription factor [Siculibacillus sp.]|nr:metalloregulator ArsR/SmtB family transcription factor [Siculibacillus sp.]
MEFDEIIEALSALAQATRLTVFRRLAVAEPGGMPAGDLARDLGVPPNTLSSHLAVLARAGLVAAERRGRFVVYRAVVARLGDLTAALTADRCGGRPNLCIDTNLSTPERSPTCPTSSSTTIPHAALRATSSP